MGEESVTEEGTTLGGLTLLARCQGFDHPLVPSECGILVS
jgi:hypothetical protein